MSKETDKLKNSMETKFNNLLSQHTLLKSRVEQLEKKAEMIEGLIKDGRS